MCAYIKGTRKRKPSIISDLNIGGVQIPFGAVIIALFAALYLFIFWGRSFESGSDAIVLATMSLVIFAFFAYAVRKQLLRLDPYVPVVDIFLGLSVIPIVLYIAQFFYINNFEAIAGTNNIAIYFLAYAIISIVAVVAILHFEKARPEDAYLQSGDLKQGLITGIAGLIALIVVALIILYFLYNFRIGNLTSGLTPAYIAIICIAAAVAEEIWFRGMLLSRFVTILEDTHANYLQAAIFAVFETIVFSSMFSSNLILVPIILVASAIFGYLCGRITLKQESILGPVIFHMGFYFILLLPILF